MNLLESVNAISTRKYDSLEDVLAFYRKELPKRTAGYHQEEVGPIMHKGLPGEADDFVNKIFSLGGYTMDMSSGLNWYGTPNGDLEWNGGLVRHGYFMLLADEYVKTGDEKYAATIIEHALNYIENVPRFDPVGKPYLEYKKSTWRPFEAAGRAAEVWPEAFGKIINSKSMTAEAWAKVLLSTHEHGDFLSIHHWKTGNHACLEVTALGLIGIFYQEFVEAEKWRKYAVDFLLNMWDEQFHTDGYTKEMSGGYHWVAMRSFFTLYEVAKVNGFESILPSIYKERLIQASMAELLQDKPDYSIPITNDSSTKTNRKEQLERINRTFNLPEIEYRLTNGKSGKAPATSFFFPVTRVGFMRSDWSEQARYLFIDMGRWGDNHMNEDQLNVEVSAYGHNFLVNCGRWRYTTSPNVDWIPKAKYFKGTASYNSVLVDGYNQVSADADGFMKVYDKYDFAEGIFSAGYGSDKDVVNEKQLKEKGIGSEKACIVPDASHKRQVIFVKPDFWIVRDTVTCNGEHEAEQIWHYMDGDVTPDATGKYMVTNFDDANLILATVGSNNVEARVFKGSEVPFRGWHCPYYDQMKPAPEVGYKQKGKNEIVFNTLIFPVKGKAATMPAFEVTATGYKVSYEGKTWEVEAPKTGEWKVK